MTALIIYGILILIIVIVCIVWRLGHISGYTQGHNDANLRKVTTYRNDTRLRKVTKYREDGSVEEVHYE